MNTKKDNRVNNGSIEPVEGKSHRKAHWAPQPRKRRGWKEMSTARKGANIILAVAEFSLTGWALWDLGHRPAEQINGRKRIWAMTSFIQPFGPLVYLIFGRRRGNAALPA